MKMLIEEYPEVVDYWSDKNEDSPDNYGICSREQKWWKCENGVHEDFQRSVIYSRKCNFVCPLCLRESKRAHNFKDITGQKFGDLTVIGIDKEKTDNAKSNSMYWKCKCSCGKEKSILGSHLRNGSIISCGDRTLHRMGENNSNWRGGITPKLISARTSKEYKQWRDSVYAKDYYTCQCCGKTGSFNKNAHHILNFLDYEDKRYDVNWGICMCEECHHIRFADSFHNIYGTRNNTPAQLETYINNKRKQLGIDIPFTIDDYQNRINILKPENLNIEKIPIEIKQEPNGSFI